MSKIPEALEALDEDELEHLILGGNRSGDVRVVQVDPFVSTSRWESVNRLVVTVDDEYWACEFTEGLTEMQETDWFGWWGGKPRWYRVKPKETVKILYVPVD